MAVMVNYPLKIKGLTLGGRLSILCFNSWSRPSPEAS